jgi:hypothetical protein
MNSFQTETTASQRIPVLQLDSKNLAQTSQNIWVSSGVTSTGPGHAAKLSVTVEDGDDRKFNFNDKINVKVIS